MAYQYTLRQRLAILGFVISVVPILAILFLTLYLNRATTSMAVQTCRELSHADLDHTVQALYDMCTMQQKAIHSRLERGARIAHQEIKAQGGLAVSEDPREIGYTSPRGVQTVSLPGLRVGEATLGSEKDPTPSPFVHSIQELLGLETSLYQRLEDGSFLLLETTIRDEDGRVPERHRFVSAHETASRLAPALAAVNQGRSYSGRVNLHGQWYITFWEPLVSEAGGPTPSGALVLALPQQSVAALRKAMIGMTVGMENLGAAARGYVWVIDSEGKYIVSKNGESDGANIWDLIDPVTGEPFVQTIIQKAREIAPGRIAAHTYHFPKKEKKLSRFTYFAEWDWIIGAGLYEADMDVLKNAIQSTNRDADYAIAGVAVLLAILAPFVFGFLASRITRSTTQAAKVMSRVAQGDLSQNVTITDDTDELGAMANSLNGMILKLREHIQDVGDGIDVLTDTSREILDSSGPLANSSVEMATSINETTATAEQMRATSEMTARGARVVREGAETAAELSRDGNAALEELTKEMELVRAQMDAIAQTILRLSEQGQEISEIVLSVEDIAEQSGLLAVNASIEAMNAGEAGKSFNVVAQAIRDLAEQSNTATGRIKSILSEIQRATGAAVMATEQGCKSVDSMANQSSATRELFDRIVESATTNSATAHEIDSSAEEQLQGVEQVVTAMEQIQTASNQTAETARKLEESSRNLHALGSRLKVMSSRYTL